MLAVVATWLTILVNVPPDNRLDADHDSGDPQTRLRFEGPWVRTDTVRAVLHTASATRLVIGPAR